MYLQEFYHLVSLGSKGEVCQVLALKLHGEIGLGSFTAPLSNVATTTQTFGPPLRPYFEDPHAIKMQILAARLPKEAASVQQLARICMSGGIDQQGKHDLQDLNHTSITSYAADNYSREWYHQHQSAKAWKAQCCRMLNCCWSRCTCFKDVQEEYESEDFRLLYSERLLQSLLSSLQSLSQWISWT